MSPRTPLDRAIDLAFGVPIAATTFAREATRLALHRIVDGGGERSPLDRADDDGFEATPPSTSDATNQADDGRSEPVPPFAGYDSMDAREIIAALVELDDLALAMAEAYEYRNRGRRTVLTRIASLRSAASS